MRVSGDRIRLGLFAHVTGNHMAAWRHPSSDRFGGTSFRHYAEVAATAERGLFDMLFLADTNAVWNSDDETLSRDPKTAQFEPLTLLSALSVVTRHIGLVATATTTYNEPYHVARKFASLDLLSEGRAGWNLVTSANPQEALNFSRDAHVEHADRYARAREFAQVVTGLWESWEDDAFVRDVDEGRFFTPGKMHVLNHRGENFAVRGPLNVPRSPQGRPVIVQAGSSETGRSLAAATAEVVFTAQDDLEAARAFYADLKSRLPALGRRPEDLKVMPGFFPVVGRSRAEAEDRFAALQELIHPSVGMQVLSFLLGGVDLSRVDPDGPLPPLPETNSGRSRQRLVVETARRDGLSIRQLYQRLAGARGHLIVIGTPADIADRMQEWFEAEAADGFNVMPPTLPGDLETFVDLVVPELQARGLFRTAYEGSTLRENLGLSFPRHSQSACRSDAE
jgi:FMN-dependent oxidoreductase (nitrilotriacetate monooxygenase family)